MRNWSSVGDGLLRDLLSSKIYIFLYVLFYKVFGRFKGLDMDLIGFLGMIFALGIINWFFGDFY